PKRVFGYIHPRRNTPVYATIAVGIVSLLAITPSLELISSMINFGALVAFTFVNLSVIAYFAIRRRQYRTLNHATPQHRPPRHRHGPHRRALELPPQRR